MYLKHYRNIFDSTNWFYHLSLTIMKKVALLFLIALGFSLNAQTLNEQGLYVDTDSDNALFNGKLFNGIVSKTQDNIKSELTIKEGVVDGPANYYYASGQLMESGSFTKGQKDQKWVRYTENGGVSAIAFYSLGKKTGTWMVFDDKGNKRYEMNYNNGEKTGLWTSWDESGAVASVKDYSSIN